MKIPFVGAACSRRAAVLTASPVTRRWPLAASPATTSPVFTPVRLLRRTPNDALQLLVQAQQRFLHPHGRPHRSQRIVLVDGRQAEHRHDGVADVLLDGPAVRLELGAHDVEVAGHHLPQGFGVEPFAQVGRALQIREDDGDRLADLLGLRRRDQGRPAIPAQAEPRGILLSAVRAQDHGIAG